MVLSVHRELRANLEAALADLGIGVEAPVAPATPDSRT
jgi:hypothetical protein